MIVKMAANSKNRSIKEVNYENIKNTHSHFLANKH